jgi:hypothetical protein
MFKQHSVSRYLGTSARRTMDVLLTVPGHLKLIKGV